MDAREEKKARTKRKAIRAGLVLAVVGLLTVAFVWKAGVDRQAAVTFAREQATAVLVDLSQDLKSRITHVEFLSRSFAGAVRLEPEITQSRFSEFAAIAALDEAGIVNVAGIRDFRIDLVYPYQENAAVIGRSLRDVPEQFRIAQRARDAGISILQGPVRLLQGFDGFILRDPVFFKRGETRQFWGFISIVFAADMLFSDQSMANTLAVYDVAIRDAGSSNMVFGDDLLLSRDAVRRNVGIPGGHWELAIMPKAGWSVPVVSGPLLLTYLLSVFASLAVMTFLFAERQKALDAADQLRAAIDVMADGFVLFDSEDRLVVCNARYLEIYAESAPAIKPGARFEDILRFGLEHGQYPGAIGREEEWLKNRLAAHDSGDYMIEQELSEGRWLRIREMATPDGGRVGIRVDITEQVLSRKRAERAEKRLRDAINTVPAGFWLFDANAQLEMTNDRAKEHMRDIFGVERGGGAVPLGASIEEMVERLVANRYGERKPEANEAEIAWHMDVLHQEFPEFEIQTNEDRWYKFFGHRSATGELVGFTLDISEIKRHAKSLEESNSRLRAVLKERDAAEARFADVADVSSEWFWEQDAQNRMIYVSPGFERATGIPAAAALGQKREDLMIGDGVSDEDGSASLMEKIEAREPFWNYIYRSAMTGDVEAWFRSSGRPVFDESGAFQGYIGVSADITLLYSALQAARRADEAKTQFLNVVSHELRTPMTIVLGFNAFLRNVDSLPEFRQLHDRVVQSGDGALKRDYEASLAQVKHFAEKIQVSGEQLQILIADMLDLARIEANTLRIDLARVSAREVVESVADQFQTLAAEKSIGFEVEVADLDVYADETRLRQVLINLIANSIKFTESGKVTLRVLREGDDAVFHVEDTGIGISSENLSVIFDRFRQVDNSATRAQGGAGLGLAITEELVKLHGGTISVSSEFGQGTRVTFTLPIWADEIPDDANPASGAATK